MLLAGDIGGTKTDLAIFRLEDGPRKPLFQARFASRNYSSLEAIIAEFLAKTNLPITHACFDVAGPVVNEQAHLTNLTWRLNETTLKDALKLGSVCLLNDLDAMAYAIPHLDSSDLYSLNVGQPVPNSNLAVIAPGTGLGEAFLTCDKGHYRSHASEGGHTNFAPSNPEEQNLLSYLWGKYDHVSYERVCSGIGIPNIYDYLKDSGVAAESGELARQLAETEDKTRLIFEIALSPDISSPLCKATLNLFISILGVEASNLTLKVLATGGIYLGGGIPLHILPALKDGRFMRAFQLKGRFAELLSNVPVQIILIPAALIGTASYGLEMTPL